MPDGFAEEFIAETKRRMLKRIDMSSLAQEQKKKLIDSLDILEAIELFYES